MGATFDWDYNRYRTLSSLCFHTYWLETGKVVSTNSVGTLHYRKLGIGDILWNT